MKFRPLLLAACLAVGTTLGAEAPQPDSHKARVPKRFIKVDMLDVGDFVPTGAWEALSAHALSVTCVIDRVRFGLSAADYYVSIDFWDGAVLLPVHVGYNLVSNPKATWLLWGAVPDLHVDAIGSLWRNRHTDGWPPSLQYAPTVELALCCDVDYYGFGADLRVGAYKSSTIYYWANSGFFVEFRLRLLTFGVGF